MVIVHSNTLLSINAKVLKLIPKSANMITDYMWSATNIHAFTISQEIVNMG